MLKRLTYLLIIFLAAALPVAGQGYIDQVCRDTQRTYRVNGEENSTWVWMLKDSDDNKITLSNPTGTDFTGTDNDGKPVYGSEIAITWSMVPGVYDLSVEQTSEFNCKNHELGQIEVSPLPAVFAGNALVVCASEPVNLNEATAEHYSSLLWSSPGDGTFDDETTLHATYTPGPADLAAGSVTLTLTAEGLLDNGTCDPASASVVITINPQPQLVITNPPAVCAPETVDLTAAAIYVGSDIPASTSFSYWEDEDATISVADYTAVSTGGTYYIKAESPGACIDIKPVAVTIHSVPALVITDPAAVCEPNTVDLSDASVTAGSEADLLYTYWKDVDATVVLTDYMAVATTGTYYIKGTHPVTACEDIKEVHVTINPQPMLVLNDPPAVCDPVTVDLTNPAIYTGSMIPENSDTTFWQDAAMTSALTDYRAVSQTGIYYINVEAPGGCSDMKQVAVTINPQPILDLIDPTPVCEPLTVDLSDSEIFVNSHIPDYSDTTYWLDVDMNTALVDYQAVSQTGTYYIRVEAPGGCFDIKPVAVVVNEQPVLVITNPLPVCEPATIDLTDPAIYTGSTIPALSDTTYWEDAAATVSLANHTAISAGGTFYIKIEAPGGCYDVKEVNVIINPLPVLVINDPDPVCEPGTIDLTHAAVTAGSEADLGFSYWEDKDATIALADYTAIAITGTYYIKGVHPVTGCEDIKEVHVTINPQPVLVITDPAVVCTPETVDLTHPDLYTGSAIPALSDTTYWEDAAATVSLANPTTVSTGGTYYIKVEAPGGCYDIKEVDVIINPLPVLVINDPDPVCEPETIDLTHAAVTAGSEADLVFSYWEDTDATVALTDYNAVSVGGTYYIKAFNPSTNCKIVSPVNVTVNPLPNLVIHDPDPVCEPNTVDLSVSSITAGSENGLIFSYWEDADATLPLANYTAVAMSGTYFIRGTNETTGCKKTEPVNVLINPLPVLVTHDPAPVCAPETIDLTDPAILTGSIIPPSVSPTYWTNSATTIPVSNPSAVDVSGIYYIKVVAGTDCEIVEPVNVVVNASPVLVINNPDQVCEPETVDLSAAAVTLGSSSDLPLTYWQDDQATIPLNNYTTVSTTGIYYIKATEQGLCPVIKPVQVFVNIQPVIAITNPPAACAPATVDLTDPAIIAGSVMPSSPVTTYWRDASATLPLSVSEASAINASGTYYIKIDAGNDCYDIKPVEVTIYPEPVLPVVNPDEVCEPETIDLTAGAVTPGIDPALVKTYWLDAAATQPVPNPEAVTEGRTYYIKATNTATGCDNIEPVQVTINKRITPTFNLLAAYCINSSAPALPTTSLEGISGSWNPAVIATDELGSFTYTFTPDPDECALPLPLTVEITNGVTPTFDPIVLCLGSTPPSLPATSKEGFTGTWNGAISTDVLGDFPFIFTPDPDQCAVEATLVVRIVDKVLPTFPAPGPYCVGGPADPLPTVSAEGVHGSWSPAVVSTSQVGIFTYHFTPDPGECAEETDIDITIDPKINPVFGTFGPYCQGGPVDPLPTTSHNGISGWWSPSAISTATTGPAIYRFTPYDACANPYPVTITVEPRKNPAFDQIADLCLDDVPPTLPSVSKNGISGSWTPATVNTSVPGPANYLFIPAFDECADPFTMTIIVNDKIVPEFDPVDPICLNNAAPALPTTSKNGIRGTWSPAAINTSVAGPHDYLFTPNAGECATTYPMTIVINDPVVPEFDLIDPICLNDVAPLLPTTSNNGISGSWNPATIITDRIGTAVYTFTPNPDECALPVPLNVEIIQPNLPPVAVDDNATTIMNIAANINVLANDTDDKGIEAYTLEIVGFPQHGTWMIESDYTITYIPDDGYIGKDEFTYRIYDNGIPCGALYDEAKVTVTVLPPNQSPIAVNDEFIAGCQAIFGDLLYNDSDPDDDKLVINTTPITQPVNGTVTIYADGTFLYEFTRGSAFTDSFSYGVCDDDIYPLCTNAMVYITVFADSDCDGVPDNLDIDKDNDGIVDWVEGDDSVDTDRDGVPDYLDIDADGDGIPDIIEAQSSGGYIAPWGIDTNHNGLDDAYEQNGNLGIKPVDTDGDGMPDFQDTDSDNDNVPDAIEGYDIGAKGIAEISPSGNDIDGDGLDDAYDNFLGGFNDNDLDNPFGTFPHLQDFDGDGIPDWRDTDDDDDGIPTKYEDYNNNDLYFDDDMDFDGHPDYLDIQGECTMFIPEGFSPNGDGIHDYFQIYCIDKYPNAKLLIFDRWGVKMYEHEKYGNRDFWGSYDRAWWDGTRTNGNANSEKLAPGNYLYILIRGDGNMDRGFVMLSH